MPKEEAMRVRVPSAMRAAILAIADARFTSESEIAREALLEYLAKRGIGTEQLRQGQIQPTAPPASHKYFLPQTPQASALNEGTTSPTATHQANFAGAVQRAKKLHKPKRSPRSSPGPKP